jgi:CpeT protein
MNQFLEYLEGHFSNKKQAQGHPTRYAHIHIVHRKISDYRFYGEQAYNYARARPYRQFVIDVIEEDGKYRLKNYEIEAPSRFVGCINLEALTDTHLTYREGCDIMFEQVGEKIYKGGTSTCECYVQWQDKKTYLENNILLTDTEYHVIDIGRDVETNLKVWGSNWGHLKFEKVGM